MKYFYNNQWNDVTLKALEGMPIGSIIQFAGSNIPTGWLVCDGRTLSVSLASGGVFRGEYAELYNVIGTTYGQGEAVAGGVQFKIPNLKGKVPVGQDTSDTDFDVLGETGGNKALQKHRHYGIFGNNGNEKKGGWGTGSTHTGILNEMTNNEYEALYTGIAGTGAETSATNGNLQPYLVVNYIIKATNTTPTFASVVNANSNSTTDTYSCDYINNKTKIDTLWTGSKNSGNITLSSSIENYDVILVVGRGEVYSKSSLVIPVSQISYYSSGDENKYTWLLQVVQTGAVYNSFYFSFTNATTIHIVGESHGTWGAGNIEAVLGVKL